MNTPRLFAIAAVVATATAVAPSSIGSVGKGCGFSIARDSILARQDSVQSSGAAKICAIYLNRTEAR
jgi:hypothetical protein